MATTLTDTASQVVEQTRSTGEQLAQRVRQRIAPGKEVNVGGLERVGTGLMGSAMTFWGLMLMVRRGSILGGLSLMAAGVGLVYRGASGYCPGYQAMGVDESDATTTSHPLSRFIHVSRRVRINRSAAELYAYWRNLQNLPSIMRHIKAVDPLDGDRSRWMVATPRGGTVAWDAKMIEDRPNELIAWRSEEGATVPNHGHVRFESIPHGHGTILEVSLNYRPPGGVVGAAVARAFGDAPSQQLRKDLRRFKQTMEAGEMATTAGQPRGKCA